MHGNELVEWSGVECMELDLDLSSLDSVRAFAAAYLERELPLNVLINNAGIMGYETFEDSADG